MPQISVLVAVYNSEKYLRECLDSLVGQTLTDIEIICIDDASTDSSLSILKDYAANDSRIKILQNTENIGQAASRNKGIEIAKAPYICYLDSDDWFNPDSLQIILDTFSKNPEADCVLFELKEFKESKSSRVQETRFNGEEAFLLSIDWRLHGVYAAKAWLFKTYPYDTATRYYSDDNSTRIHYLHSHEVILSNAVYNYRQHPDAGTTKLSIHTFDHIIANLSLRQQLIAEKVSDEALCTLETYRLYNLMGACRDFILHRKHFTADEQKEITSRITTVLATIDTPRIPAHIKYRFGYYPFKSPTLFILQENTFWKLRKMLGLEI